LPSIHIQWIIDRQTVSDNRLLFEEQMGYTLSEFHYSTFFIDGSSFASEASFHAEIEFKLGLPSWYGRNLDALLDCLSSIGNPQDNLCSHWEWLDGKRLVLRIHGLSMDKADMTLVAAFLQTIADANERLEQEDATNRIWVEYTSANVNTS
jgi:hypothetical protein